MKQKIAFFFVLFCFLSIQDLSAEHQIERRIYLLDVTLSMKGYNNAPNIYDEIIQALELEIDNITDPTTEIFVLPFQQKVLGCYHNKATHQGKLELIEKIKTFDFNKVTYTNLYLPIVEAKNKYIRKGCRNLLFLLTDGKHNDIKTTSVNLFIDELASWEKYAMKNNAYAYYVLLTDNAQPSESVINAINSTNRLDLLTNPGNLSFISLNMPSEININIEDLKKEYIDIKINTDHELPKGIVLLLNCEENSYFNIPRKVIIKNGTCRIKLYLKQTYSDIKKNMSELVSINLFSKISNKDVIFKKTNNNLIFCGDKTNVKIKNKKESVLIIEVVDYE